MDVIHLVLHGRAAFQVVANDSVSAGFSGSASFAILGIWREMVAQSDQDAKRRFHCIDSGFHGDIQISGAMCCSKPPSTHRSAEDRAAATFGSCAIAIRHDLRLGSLTNRWFVLSRLPKNTPPKVGYYLG